MENHRGVKLSDLVEEYHLEILRKGSGYDKCVITVEDVNRPGLQLTGFFDYFDPERLQVLGKVESTYLQDFGHEARLNSFEHLFEKEIPALIITRGIVPFSECMEMAEKYDRTILRSQDKTSAFMGALISGLRNRLAPRITRHGVLLEIYGEGVLITGESGVGKSETAIELIKRGHRLIADDAVEITRTGDNQLVGTAPELIRYYMELRGIGVVDVRRLFGMSAIKDFSAIDLALHLENWQEGAVYDRLGAEEQTTEILGVELPSVTIPVRPGRNLAIIVEVAAMNNRHKKMGYNAAQELIERQNRYFAEALAAQEQENK